MGEPELGPEMGVKRRRLEPEKPGPRLNNQDFGKERLMFRNEAPRVRLACRSSFLAHMTGLFLFIRVFFDRN